MSKADHEYFGLVRRILAEGRDVSTRAGAARSIFGATARFNLQDGLPLLTTKKLYVKGIVHELLWFLGGDTNIKYLVDNGVHIWDDDAYRWYRALCATWAGEGCAIKPNGEFDMPGSKAEFLDAVKRGLEVTVAGSHAPYTYRFGDMGDVYGAQWRRWESCREGGVFDQIGEIVHKLRTDPDSRRMLLTAWNVGKLNCMGLPPCHYSAQFHTRRLTQEERNNIARARSVAPEAVAERTLDCLFNCRSQDVPLGTPYNWASYAILTHMLAHCVGMEVGDLVWVGGDCHIYLNQMDGIQQQLTRDPDKHISPMIWLNPNVTDPRDFVFDDIRVIGYSAEPAIKMPLSVGG